MKNKAITRIAFACGLIVIVILTMPTANAQEKDYTNLLIPKGPAKTFEEHLVKTQVSKAVQETLETVPDTKPFIMLNFMRYRPHRDPTLYMRYAMAAGDGIDVEGSYTPYYASAIHDLHPAYGFDNSWDEMTMPVYSRLASYALAQSNPAYQAGLPDRVAGTFQRHLYALKDGKQIFPATLTIQKLHDNRQGIPFKKSDVLIGEFLRFKNPNGRETFVNFAKAVSPLIEKAGGEVLLSVEVIPQWTLLSRCSRATTISKPAGSVVPRSKQQFPSPHRKPWNTRQRANQLRRSCTSITSISSAKTPMRPLSGTRTNWAQKSFRVRWSTAHRKSPRHHSWATARRGPCRQTWFPVGHRPLWNSHPQRLRRLLRSSQRERGQVHDGAQEFRRPGKGGVHRGSGWSQG